MIQHLDLESGVMRAVRSQIPLAAERGDRIVSSKERRGDGNDGSITSCRSEVSSVHRFSSLVAASPADLNQLTLICSLGLAPFTKFSQEVTRGFGATRQNTQEHAVAIGEIPTILFRIGLFEA